MNKDFLVEKHKDEELPLVEALIECIKVNMPKRYLLLPVFERLKIFK